MSAPPVTGAKKICVKCGQDVTHAPRMKDSEGRYWCVPCGEKDRLHRMHANAGICEMCGESFNHAQLIDIGGQLLCQRCRKRKFAGGGSGGLLSSIKSLFRK